MLPKIAIIDSNTLQAMGLKSIIMEIIPIAEVCVFSSFGLMEKSVADSFFHFFISARTLLENSAFFLERRHRTIVFTAQRPTNPVFSNFHILGICQPERMLVKDILCLYEKGHGHAHAHDGRVDVGSEIPVAGEPVSVAQGIAAEVRGFHEHSVCISPREAEVLAFIVKGYINKEIADKLNISVTTVVTHRKNISEKLGMKSVSALTIYAVTHGIVGVDEI